jgi:hypothetical protein
MDKKLKKKLTKITELVISDENEELSIDAISLVTSPAIEVDFVYFGKEKNNLTFAKVDEEKRMLVSPALIPNKQIFRYDPNTDQDYYVYFSKDTVRKASELYLKHNNHHKATYQHEQRVAGVLTVESWIKEGEEDKSKMYGFDLPIGTWFVKMKIENEDLWSRIKEGELRGLSIEGYFVDKMQEMSRPVYSDEEVLTALAEIVSPKKVELGLMDDIQKIYKDAQKLSSVAENKGLGNLRKTILKVENDFLQLLRKSSEGLDLIEKAEKQLKELGVNKPKELQGIENVLKSYENIAEDWIKRLGADQYR